MAVGGAAAAGAARPLAQQVLYLLEDQAGEEQACVCAWCGGGGWVGWGVGGRGDLRPETDSGPVGPIPLSTQRQRTSSAPAATTLYHTATHNGHALRRTLRAQRSSAAQHPPPSHDGVGGPYLLRLLRCTAYKTHCQTRRAALRAGSSVERGTCGRWHGERYREREQDLGSRVDRRRRSCKALMLWGMPKTDSAHNTTQHQQRGSALHRCQLEASDAERVRQQHPAAPSGSGSSPPPPPTHQRCTRSSWGQWRRRCCPCRR